MSNPQLLNRYAYCLNDPTVLTDPVGHGGLLWPIITLISTLVFLLTEWDEVSEYWGDLAERNKQAFLGATVGQNPRS